MFRTKKEKIIFPAAVLLGLMLLSGLSFLIWIKTQSSPVSSEKKEILLEIKKGASMNKILDDLENRGIIRSALAGRYLVFFRGYTLKSGDYSLSPSMGLEEILRNFHQGKEQLSRITFPEGLHALEYAQILKKNGFSRQAEEFLIEVKNPVFLRQFQIPFESADGFLFPSTYYFPKGITGAQIARKMISTFFDKTGKKFSSLPEERKKTILILASIVEKEAVTDNERSMIASVFYNRLSKKMLLESCATVIYAFEKQGIEKTRLLYRDLNISSPFNTYRNTGLPPSPICNPGLKSIEAALNPSETPYLYFVYRGNGSHVFSTNLQDHMKAYRQFILYQNRRKNS